MWLIVLLTSSHVKLQTTCRDSLDGRAEGILWSEQSLRNLLYRLLELTCLHVLHRLVGIDLSVTDTTE